MAENSPEDDLRASVNIGLADFIATLVVETFEALIAASTSQEDRSTAFQAAADFSVEEFAATGITEAMLDAALLELFPDGEGGTQLVPGHTPPDTQTLQELDIKLDKSDIRSSQNSKVLTDQGVEHIRQALALYMAKQQLDTFKKVQHRGIPKVVVDHGVLRARVGFSTLELDSADSDKQDGSKDAIATPKTKKKQGSPTASTEAILAAQAVSNVAKTRALLHTPIEAQLVAKAPLRKQVLESIHRTRLLVSTPNINASSNQDSTSNQVQSNAYGEVEIHFRIEDGRHDTS